MLKYVLFMLLWALPVLPVLAVAPPAPLPLQETQQQNAVAMPVTQGIQTSSIMIDNAGEHIWDVDLRLNLSHSANGDLNIVLIAPSGKRSVMVSQRAGNLDDVFSDGMFDDQANELATQFVFNDGVAAPALVPEGALGSFVNENPNGMWSLEIEDLNAVDDGQLISWELTINAFNGGALSTISEASMDAVQLENLATTEDQLSVVDNGEPIIAVSLFISATMDRTGEYEIELISPTGTVVPVSINNGANNADGFSNTFFSDIFLFPITDVTFFNGAPVLSAQPEGALSAFMGEQSGGDWTLRFIDDDPVDDTGRLAGWGIDIFTLAAGPLPEVDVSINKQVLPVGAPVFTLGAQALYTITIENAGPDLALDVLVTDNLPAGTTYVSDNCGGLFADPQWSWNAGDLAAGGLNSCDVLVDIVQTGIIDNTAAVSSASDDVDLSNNSASVQFEVLDGPQFQTDVSILKQALPVGPPTFSLGAQALYTITVENNGPDQALDVVVTDNLPAGTAYVSDNCGGLFADPQWSWSVGDLVAGGLNACDVLVDILQVGVISNTAVVTTVSTDTDLSNNTDTVQFEVLGGPLEVYQVPVNDPLFLMMLMGLFSYSCRLFMGRGMNS
ncbi:proprotein convertase P-domain-containing protein [Marinicella sp. W31]|uniref:proprotein convertase P-domain-containing protein n=1 Tax=Marinicella sp. W31 TaxID=3023713 RepID=UPI003756D698